MKSAAVDESPVRARLRSRFRGALLGLAIGDALGFSYEGRSRTYLQALGRKLLEGFVKDPTGQFPAGQYSDDTQLTLATIEAVIGSCGVDRAAVADAYLHLWREQLLIGRDRSNSDAMARIVRGDATWHDAAVGSVHADCGVAKRIIGIGLWDYDQPTRLREDVAIVGGVTHRDPRALAGAAAVAAAIAHNLPCQELVLGEFLDAVSAAAANFDEEVAKQLRSLPRFLSLNEEAVLRQLQALGDPGAPASSRYPWGMHVIPAVLLCFYYFLRSPTDYAQAVQSCLQVGGQTETVCALTGALCGALNGIGGLPKHLGSSVLDRDRLLAVADRLFSTKQATRGS